jgi:hypothetical protein
MRQYLIALPVAFLAVVYHYLFWIVPLGGLSARVTRTVWRKRGQFGVENPLHPIRLLTVAGILLLIDMATWAGAAAWAWREMVSKVRRLRIDGFRIVGPKPTDLGRSDHR